jgi:hypothetical protein
VNAPRLTDTPDLSPHALQAAFLASVLPKVLSHGRVYFRHLRSADRKEEYIAEMVALAWRWHLRLAQRGKDAAQFPTAIAKFAARAVASGRKLAGMDRTIDALSPLAQRRHSFAVGKLPDYSALDGSPLEQALHDSTRSRPADLAAFRLDLPCWLATLGARDRRIALDLALGYRTQELARAYRLSEPRISQLRRQLHRSWQQFQGELPAPARRAGGGAG